MSKILYILDNNENRNYQYNIEEDTILYHFSINSSSTVDISLVKEGVTLYYYYSTINYQDHDFHLKVSHLAKNTHSEVFCHGVNVSESRLLFQIDGIVPKNQERCICNQENQIMNLGNGKSTIRPNLLIDCYDVDSNHAAYIGKFKEEVLFYLESRGISRKKSYELLLNGFLIMSDSIDQSKITPFLEEILKL